LAGKEVALNLALDISPPFNILELVMSRKFIKGNKGADEVTEYNKVVICQRSLERYRAFT